MKNLNDWHVIDDGNQKYAEVIVEIRNNETKEIAKYVDREPIYEDDEEHPSLFNWCEHNYSCDCNRELFFRREMKLPEIELAECTNERYDVQLSNAKTKEIYYTEFDKED